MMNVFSLNTDAVHGGAARTAVTLCNAINKLDTRVKITLFHAGQDSDSNNSINLNRLSSRYLNALSLRLAGESRIFDLGLASEALRRSQHYDAIHLHNLHGYYVDYQRLLQGFRNTPVLWTWHDMWPLTGRCASPQACEKWKTGCSKCPNPSYYPKAWVDWAKRDFEIKRKAISALERLYIVCPSRWLAKNAILAGYPQERIFVIPNPSGFSTLNLEDRLVARKKLQLDENKKYLLFVAADCGDTRKGFPDFEKIIAATGMNGIAIGKLPHQYKGSIQLAGLLQSTAEIGLYYSAADAFVIPSYIDNYPNTVIEALSCGTPVFGYPTGGIPEQVPDQATFISETKAPDALTRKITRYFNSPPAYATKSYFADFADSNWAVSNVASQYADLLIDICD